MKEEVGTQVSLVEDDAIFLFQNNLPAQGSTKYLEAGKDAQHSISSKKIHTAVSTVSRAWRATDQGPIIARATHSTVLITDPEQTGRQGWICLI